MLTLQHTNFLLRYVLQGCASARRSVYHGVPTTDKRQGWEAPFTQGFLAGADSAAACKINCSCRGAPTPGDQSIVAFLQRVRDKDGKPLPELRFWSESSIMFFAGEPEAFHCLVV